MNRQRLVLEVAGFSQTARYRPPDFWVNLTRAVAVKFLAEAVSKRANHFFICFFIQKLMFLKFKIKTQIKFILKRHQIEYHD